MRRFRHLALTAAVLLGAGACSEAPVQPESPGQRNERLQWWREARFGLFIHWGLYAIPAGEWDGRTDHAEWIRTTARIPVKQYEALASRFNPVDFDPDRWARIAKQAGMQYVIITSKHHDGFCLWDSAHTDFDAAATPFGRDLLREFAAACRRQGLRVGWYHSIMDWHHPDYLPRREWELAERPADGADFDRYKDYLHSQVTELLTEYGEVDVMWFDGEWESTWTHEDGVELYDLCRRLQPEVLVNNRVDKGREGMAGMTAGPEFVGDFGTPEQEVPARGIPGVDWEACMTMNEHWGYNRADRDYKSATELIRTLVDVASKGGNFLLNVGPTGDGIFPQPAVERLQRIGAWMDVNGVSIYGTRASPFPELPWGRATTWSGPDGHWLYLQVFDWPEGEVLVVPGLSNDVRRAWLLANPNRDLGVTRDQSDLWISVPARAPDPACSVVALELDGPPRVNPAPELLFESAEFVRPMLVAMRTPVTDAEIRYTVDGSQPSAVSPRYERPLRISATTRIRARLYRDDRPISPAVTRELVRVEPVPGTAQRYVQPGLRCRFFEGTWRSLPDFSELRELRRSIVPDVGLSEAPHGEYYGLRFEGFLRVPEDAFYRFRLTSDDGSRLLLDGRTIVENDGLHVARAAVGTAALGFGEHPIAVEWFNRSGDAQLSLEWAPLGAEFEPVPASALSRMP